MKSGADTETLLTGGGGGGGGSAMEKGQLIDGTDCSPKAVLACRSVSLVFISFSVHREKVQLLTSLSSLPDSLLQHISQYLSPAYSRFFNLYV